MAESVNDGRFTRPLRIGLLIDSRVQPRWIYDAIREMQSSGVARVTLLVERDLTEPDPGAFARLYRRRHQLLYTLFTRIDEYVFRETSYPFTPTDISPLVGDCPVIRVVPRMTKFSDYLEDADVDAIRAHDLDVAVRFGFRILKGRALDVARHGVWSYHHGDNLVNRGGPPGFWEVMEGNPVTGSILQIISEELDAGRVIYRSYASTDRRSVARSKHNYYQKSAAFLARKLRDLHEHGPAALCDAGGEVWTPYSNRLYVVPNNREMARMLLTAGGRFIADSVQNLVSYGQWFLAYRFAPPEAAAPDVPDLVPYRFKPLIPPRKYSWADPFPIRVGGRYYVFFEEWAHGDLKAHIAVAELGRNGFTAPPVTVLERPYHVSYPFVFEWNGRYYMVPETASNRTVELYRAVEFPYRWELERTLLADVRAVDATLAEADGRWWMFVNMAVGDAATEDELHVYHAETPLGPWRPHRRNPVKSDVRSARPAGRLFRHRGQLYRPAQDCSVSYGHAVVINRVRRLDPDHYEEEVGARIDPHWFPRLTGTHTVSADAGLTVIDGRRWRRRYF
jgi:hypothetical protein